ncbi:ATP-dependent helicase [Mycoplasma sp. 3341]|uniref:ATP-dependent helicase n=1 Tax=Mycoplasma sp. 3341 TaxID=3447506 RepID=UPI003F660323
MSTEHLDLTMLNEKQLEAVKHTQGPLRLIAGAGSGKTKVLTTKVAYLIKEKEIVPSKILAVTFTKKAADEMLDRVVRIIGSSEEHPHVSTFHSLCAKILRSDIHVMGIPNDFKIIDDPEQRQILKLVYDKLDITNEDYTYDSVLSYISKEKVSLRKPKHSLENAEDKNDLRPTIYKEYVEYLKRGKALDFDDLLVYVHDLFHNPKYEATRHKWESKFDYVLVDEFQDTSHVQYGIVKVLAKKGDITIVGDPDQTIYSWRNADINIIINFEKDFPNVTTILLEKNYRSTKKILNAANNLISYNSLRIKKKLYTDNEEGEDIEFNCGFSDEDEARWISMKINELKKNRVQLKNIAIIYRANSYSRAIEGSLINDNTNHYVVGTQRFYEREEVKDALAYLQLIYAPDDLSLQRVINKPARAVGKETVRKLYDFSLQKDVLMFTAIEEHIKEIYETLKINMKTMKGLADVVNKVRWARTQIFKHKQKPTLILRKLMYDELKYFESLKVQPETLEAKEENFNALINAIDAWEEQNKNKELTDYLQEVVILGNEKPGGDPLSSVALMTVHNAKGLEFDYVFVAGLAEGVFPNARALNVKNNDSTKKKGLLFNKLSSEQIEALEEERRLAYVAFTRAKKKLFLSFSAARNGQESRFISEAGVKGGKRGIHIASMFAKSETEDTNNLIEGDSIIHSKFGEGKVLQVQGDVIHVKFQGDGIKTLNKTHPSIRKKED